MLKGGSEEATPILTAAVPLYDTQEIRIDDPSSAPTEEEPLLVAVSSHEQDVTSVTTVDMPESDDGLVCRDVFFAVLFYAHVLVVLYAGTFVAPRGYELLGGINVTSVKNSIHNIHDTMDDDSMQKMTPEDWKDFDQGLEAVALYLQVYPQRILVWMVLPCLGVAFGYAILTTLCLIRPYPAVVVRASLVSTVAGILIMLLVSLVQSGAAGAILSLVILVAVLRGVMAWWKMVPFAAVNLQAALQGVTANSGLYLIALIFGELGFVWTIYWFYALIGVGAYENHQCSQRKHVSWEDDVCGPPAGILLLFLLSLYWTGNVLCHTVQVTVAGVVATWAYDKDDARGCCSPAVYASLFRSLVYSFGSICFGSLMQAFVTVLRVIADSSRDRQARDENVGLIYCLLQCLTCMISCIEDVLEYFNQWAYVYVGIYGYSYLKSGKSVMELFRSRGWSAIVSDKLVGFTLGYTTFTVALLSGFTAIGIEHAVSSTNTSPEGDASYIFGPLPGCRVLSFCIGFVVGLNVSSILMSVVQGAVNTVIVCWADAPAAMQSNHPVLTSEMAEKWSLTFPSDFVRVPQAMPVNTLTVSL